MRYPPSYKLKTTPEYLYEIPLMIPAAISSDKKLTLQAKYFYGVLLKESQFLGECIDTNQYLADQCGVQPRAVQLWLRSLLAKGYISIRYDSDEFMKMVQSKRPIRAIEPLVWEYGLNEIHTMQRSQADALGVEH